MARIVPPLRAGTAARHPQRGLRLPRRSAHHPRPRWPRRRGPRSRPMAASQGSRPAASRAPMSPASTSPAPAVASQGSPVVVTRTRPSGRATSVCRPFSRTTASKRCAARRACTSGRASISSRARPSIAASSPACGVSTAGTPSGPSTWASASASTTTGTSSARAARRAAAASSPPPGPTTQACTRPAPTDLGVGDPDAVGHGVGTGVAHHPGESAGRARDAQQRGSRVGVAAGADPHDAPAVLLGVPVRSRQQGCHVVPTAGPPPPPAAGRVRCRRGALLRSRRLPGRRGAPPCGCRT